MGVLVVGSAVADSVRGLTRFGVIVEWVRVAVMGLVGGALVGAVVVVARVADLAPFGWGPLVATVWAGIELTGVASAAFVAALLVFAAAQNRHR